VILLFICTSTYVHSLFPTIMDRNKEGYASLLLPCPPICWEAINYNKSMNLTNGFHFCSIMGIFWKSSRIGERLSPYVSIFCVVMAFSLLVGV
jgi:hypothetical protein